MRQAVVPEAHVAPSAVVGASVWGKNCESVKPFVVTAFGVSS